MESRIGKYRKSLKNYTSRTPVNNIIKDITEILLDFGATGVGFDYKDGYIKGIQFKINVMGGDKLVIVPCEWEKVKVLLSGPKSKCPNDKAYRVAMANVRDWLDAQLAMMATNMVEFPQIFLPYMTNNEGKSLYEAMKQSNFYLLENKND